MKQHNKISRLTAMFLVFMLLLTGIFPAGVFAQETIPAREVPTEAQEVPAQPTTPQEASDKDNEGPSVIDGRTGHRVHSVFLNGEWVAVETLIETGQFVRSEEPKEQARSFEPMAVGDVHTIHQLSIYNTLNVKPRGTDFAGYNMVSTPFRDENGEVWFCMDAWFGGPHYHEMTEIDIATRFTPEQIKLGGEANYFGMGSSVFNDLSAEDRNFFTQAYIWEHIPSHGPADGPFGLYPGLSGGTYTAIPTMLQYDMVTPDPAKQARYDDFKARMNAAIEDFETTPDFGMTRIELRPGVPMTLTDRNGVLSQYRVEASAGITASVSGNTLTLTASARTTGTITLTRNVPAYYIGESKLVRRSGVNFEGQPWQDMGMLRIPQNAIPSTELQITTTAPIVVNIEKTSARPEYTVGNDMYSLEGAVFDVFENSDATGLLGSITTDAEGRGSLTDIDADFPVYIKERIAPKGYHLNKEIVAVNETGTTRTGSAVVANEPKNDPIAIQLIKEGELNGQTMPSLAGTQFTFKYYGGLYNDVASLPATPTRTWVFEVQEVAGLYLLLFSAEQKVSGDDLYLTPGGNATLPLGTITIEETKAAPGYTLGGSYRTLTGEPIADVNGVILRQITEHPDGAFLVGEREFIRTDEVVFGGLKLQKMDHERGDGQAQGNATLGSAVFELRNISEHSIFYRNAAGEEIEILAGEVVDELVADETGYVELPENALMFGRYRITEITAPQGYTAEGEITREFSITEDGEIVDLTDPDSAIRNIPNRGGLEIVKLDDQLLLRGEAQGDATLAGAKFEIVNRSQAAILYEGEEIAPGEVVVTLTTDDTGFATLPANALVYGDYDVRESAPPTGYQNEGQIVVSFRIAEDGSIVDLTSPEEAMRNLVIRGGVEIQKRDQESGMPRPLGDASLAGAEFEITNRSEHVVIVDDERYEPGEVVKTIITGANGIARTAIDTLPYGRYEINEVKAPLGYLRDGAEPKFFEIREHGVMVDLTDSDQSIYNQVIRGDFSIRKIDGGTQNTMAGVTFRITSITTGESHLFTVDENGYYSSSSDWNPHSQDTNGNTPESGMWFGQYVDEEGNIQFTEVNDDVGALPYGTYHIEEIRTEANQGYEMWDGYVVIRRHGVEVALHNIENTKILLASKATNEETGGKSIGALNEQIIQETLYYEGVRPGQEYTYEAGVMLVDEEGHAAPLIDREGRMVTATHTFTPKTTRGEFSLQIPVDLTGIETIKLVVVGRLYHGETPADDQLVAVHIDLEDEEQTLDIVKIGTQASASDTGSNMAPSIGEIELQDTIIYRGLEPGKEYTIQTVLMDQETNEPLLVDGKPVTYETRFRPETREGEYTISILVDAEKLAGKTAVFFEEIYLGSVLIAEHKDIEDEDQTVYFPEIGTIGYGSSGEDKLVEVSETATAYDEIFYKNLLPGTYLVETKLYDKTTGQMLQDREGVDLVFTQIVEITEESGVIRIEIELDTTEIEGHELVFFETVYREMPGEEEEDDPVYVPIASHEDPEDEDQLVFVDEIPRLRTKAFGSDGETKWVEISENAVLHDTIEYSGIKPGTYELVTKIWDKTAGELLDAEYREVVKITETTGEIHIQITLDTRELSGHDLVFFEYLYPIDDPDTPGDEPKTPIAEHEDPEDINQTVTVKEPEQPKIGTTAYGSDGKTKRVEVKKDAQAYDVIRYEGLTPGLYTLVTKLWNKTDGTFVQDENGKDLVFTVDMPVESSEGEFRIDIELDTRTLAGKDLVFFEYIYTKPSDGEEPKLVTKHEDPNDEDQLVSVKNPKVATQARGSNRKNQIVDLKVDAKLYDTIKYQDFAPGTYKLETRLYDKSTKDFVKNSKGEDMVFTAVFTVTESSGETTFEFVLDTTKRSGRDLVFFEYVYDADGHLYAKHTDPNDPAQTITVYSEDQPVDVVTSAMLMTPFLAGLGLLSLAGAGAFVWRAKRKEEEELDAK